MMALDSTEEGLTRNEPAAPVGARDALSIVAGIVATGRIDPEASVWLVRRLTHWVEAGDGPSLPACLGLPSTPSSVRRVLRDRWLREAAAHLTGGPWERAEQLRRRLGAFRACKWRAWRRLRIPPATADAIDICAFHALKSGAPIPGSTQGMRNAIDDQSGTVGQVG
jgi:hypothetical protein